MIHTWEITTGSSAAPETNLESQPSLGIRDTAWNQSVLMYQATVLVCGEMEAPRLLSESEGALHPNQITQAL